jgi:hypothetical protein
MKIRLRLTPGTGLLAREQSDLVFLPTADPATADVFVSAAPGERLEALGRHAAATNYEVPFVAISCSATVQIAVAGHAEARSSDPSLASISRLEGQRMIDSRLEVGPAGLAIAAGSSEVWDCTSLVDGVVPAGGFLLELLDHPVRADDELVAPDPAHPIPPGPSTDGVGGGGMDERSSVSQPPRGSVIDVLAQTPESTIDAVKVRALMAELAGKPQAERVPESGADALRPASSTSEIGRLVFGDGSEKVVEGTMVFGRNPAPNGPVPGETPISVPDDTNSVSRRHAVLQVRQGDVELSDLGSTGGTTVERAGADDRIAIQPGVPLRLQSGDRVRLADVFAFAVVLEEGN